MNESLYFGVFTYQELGIILLFITIYTLTLIPKSLKQYRKYKNIQEDDDIGIAERLRRFEKKNQKKFQSPDYDVKPKSEQQRKKESYLRLIESSEYKNVHKFLKTLDNRKSFY